MSNKANLKYAWHNYYYKEELLGKGGNARVFLVSEKKTGNKYAMKQLVKNNDKCNCAQAIENHEERINALEQNTSSGEKYKQV